MKIKWTFYTRTSKYLPFFGFDYWIEKRKMIKKICWIYFDLKPFLKSKNQNFRINFLIWYQKMIFKNSFFFQFLLWNWKMKNEKFSKFVLFLNQKTNYTFGTRIIEITFLVIFTSMVSHVIQEQVRIMSIGISRCTMITRAPSICCLDYNWFILIFILLAATFTNHISRSSYREVLS